MRSSPRLSLFAAACTVAMIVSVTSATEYEYSMAATGGSNKEGAVFGAATTAAWTFTSIGNSNNRGGNGWAYYNASGDHMETIGSYDEPITNVVVEFKVSSASAERILKCFPQYSGGYGSGMAFPLLTSANSIAEFSFSPGDAITGIKLQPEGGTGTWTIYKVTIYTGFTPPTITIQSPPQEVGTASDLVVHFSATSFDGDGPLTFSATAENLTSGVTITDQSYFLFDHNYSMMHPDYYDFTYLTPSELEPCSMRFTITATGHGGSASQSFVCTFVEGTVPTPPQIYSPWLNPPFVLAGRTISGRVGCEEADGDIVTFSFVSGTSQGTFSIDPSSGDFSFTPTLQDVGDSPEVHVFTVRATDKDGSNNATIMIVVFPVSQPKLTPIDDLTMAFGDTLFIDLEAEATEYVQGEYIADPLLSSNITVKAGTTAPAGEYAFEDGVLSFEPAEADIGQTFIFTASATDLDGTTNQDFNVTVGLAAPVLKHCTVDDWTATSFTADIEEAVPGATSYNLRRINSLPGGTKTTQTVNNVTFPYTFTDLPATNQHYWAQAVRGNTVSAWSAEQTVSLQNWLPFVPAIRMTKDAGGVYTQDFNSLIKSGTGKWYDGRTLPGWHTCWYGKTITDTSVNYEAFGYTNNLSHQGFFSFETDGEDSGNRAFGMRNDAQSAYAQIGIAFTNECRYAVTNVFISFTAAQFRDASGESWLRVQYAKTDAVRSLHQGDWPDGQTWKNASALDFKAPVKDKAQAIQPKPASELRSGNIALTGEDAIQPGEVLLIQWWMDEPNNGAPLGIDDLTVSWQCAWPRHTVIYLQ